MPVHVDGAVQRGWIAPKAALPVVVAQHHIRFAAFELVFIGREQTADGRRHPQNVEIVARDQFGRGPLGWSFAGDIDGILIPRRDPREGIGRPLQIGIHGI